MDAGDWIGLGSAGVAGVAAGIAIWQARIAKASAAAAKTQAKAAERQVLIMEQQLANENADRDHAAGPVFQATSAVIVDDYHGQPEARITVEQAAGAPLSKAIVSTRTSDNVFGLVRGDETRGSVEWTDTAEGSICALRAALEYNFITPVNVVLDFACVEAHGDRTWQRSITAVPQRPPEEPQRRSRVRWVQ
ncbi:hypothetical protein ACIGXG_03605 [Streptomyces goshikiensis]|uniref:hypothetical protein n=1 Tax=Streptomyces goshikiensis TaxID=1942 RepID=UPI0037D36628